MTNARLSSVLLFIMLVTSLGLAACGEQKDTVAKQLIGSWQCSAQTIIYSDGRETRQDPAIRVEFFADGSYRGEQAQASSQGTYQVIDAHHYTYQVTQSDHAEQVGLTGTTAFSVTAEQFQVIVSPEEKGANAVKRIETTCHRQ